MCLLQGFNCCKWRCLFLLTFILPAISCQRLSSTLIEGQYACPGQEVNFTCVTNGSLVMAWISDEYIGRLGAQLEFTYGVGVGTMKRSTKNPNTVATLVRINGTFVTESDLRIIVSVNFSIASIACTEVGHGVSNITFQLLAIPGTPRNVTAGKIASVEDGDCVVLIQWMPPSIGQSSIHHYVVDSPSGSSTTTNTSIRVAVLVQHCMVDTYIRVHAIDYCGRHGPSTTDILAQVFNVTSISLPTGAGLITHPEVTKSGNSVIVGRVLGALFGISCLINVIAVGVIMCMRLRYSKRHRRGLQQSGQDHHELQELESNSTTNGSRNDTPTVAAAVIPSCVVTDGRDLSSQRQKEPERDPNTSGHGSPNDTHTVSVADPRCVETNRRHVASQTEPYQEQHKNVEATPSLDCGDVSSQSEVNKPKKKGKSDDKNRSRSRLNLKRHLNSITKKLQRFPGYDRLSDSEEDIDDITVA